MDDEQVIFGPVVKKREEEKGSITKIQKQRCSI